MTHTNGQKPVLYVEDGSMTVLPAGSPTARQISDEPQNFKFKPEDATEEKERVAYDAEAPSTVEDDTDVMGALEKQEKTSFPEGGREAWLTVLGTFCCNMVTFGVLNTYGVSTKSRPVKLCIEAEHYS
jgi:hypothetical protein